MKKCLYLLLIGVAFSNCTTSVSDNVQEETVENPASVKEICVTIDDLPVVNYGVGGPKYLQEITQDLITTFDRYEIPAIGFVNERKLFKNGRLDTNQVNILRMWLAGGYELGNHTFSHMNRHENSFDAYTKDILRGEEVSSDLSKEHNLPYRYFRHPYLRVGQSKTAHDSLNTFLDEHGYAEAPVTIDNEDYLFARAYSRAMEQEDEEMMKKMGEDYVDYMEKKLIHFESISHKLFERNIKHILLLHANKINADYLDDLAEMYKRHGYTFSTLENVLSDPAYESEISKYGNWGISWLDRWALSQGKKGKFFEGDPRTPEYIANF